MYQQISFCCQNSNYWALENYKVRNLILIKWYSSFDYACSIYISFGKAKVKQDKRGKSRVLLSPTKLTRGVRGNRRVLPTKLLGGVLPSKNLKTK